jgi:hypothetical protein
MKSKMETSPNQGLSIRYEASQRSCRQPDCACALPIGERFVLWACRQ